MKVRLFDIIDLSRPLAKAARDFDWTEVVKLFPEAHHEGLSAAKIWILASLVVLSEVTGLSEGEVLSRWPENPYWQVFSGFDQFQWKTPVSANDCMAFRRFINPARAARLSALAKSIRESKTVDEKSVTAPIPSAAGSSGDETLALRQVHFLQPLPAAPYKAPPRPDFNSSVKHTYAKSAAAKAKEEPAKNETPQPPAPPAADAGKTTPALPAPGTGAPPGQTPEAAKDPKAPEKGTPEPAKKEAEDLTKSPAQNLFAETYTQMFRNKGVVPMEPAKPLPKSQAPPSTPVQQPPAAIPPPPAQAPTPEPTPATTARTQSRGPLTPPPASKPAPVAQPPSEPPTPIVPSPLMPDPFQIHSGTTPKFDTTAPLVLRSPPGEPVRMEVNAAGEGPMEYQWEQWDDARGVAIPIEGCTGPSLTVALEPEDSMLAFQCRVFNAAAPEGAVSRTFFLKKINTPVKPANPAAEKFDPKPFAGRS